MHFANFRRLIFGILIVFLSVSNADSLLTQSKLNLFALIKTHQLMNVHKQYNLNNLPTYQISKKKSSHFQWINFIFIYDQDKRHSNPSEYVIDIFNDSIYFSMIKVIFPNNLDIAKQAVDLFPENVEILFWYGELLQDSQPQKSIEIYKSIIEKNPKNAYAWMRLGFLNLKYGNLQDAKFEFIQCCNYGDPGSNGCYNAGKLFEKEGDFENAIYYYSLSKFPPSLEAANRLQKNNDD